MAKKPSKRGPRGATREQLLQAAKAELVDSGGELELARVAKRAGVSDGLTYYHFGNKAGLIGALVRQFYAALDDQVIAVPLAGNTWAERERGRVYAMVEFFYTDPVALIVASRLSLEPSLMAEEAERSARINELGARNIAHAQKNGEINVTYNPYLLVAMILEGVMAGVRTALNTRPVTPLSEAQREIWGFVARAAGLQP